MCPAELSNKIITPIFNKYKEYLKIGELMSRPKPKVILNYTDPKTYKSEQVLAADGIYAVFYQDQPINLRTIKNSLLSDIGLRYKKSSFSNQGHAFNQAEKLNKMFKTDKFQVVKLTAGTVIREKDE
jgi:hypothetical protein